MLDFAVSPGAWEELRPVIYGYEECMPGHFFGPAVRHYCIKKTTGSAGGSKKL